MGDSAGGWFVAQLLVCLSKLALGEPLDLPGEADVTNRYNRETFKRVRERVKKAVLISPALEMDMGSTDHPEDAEIQPAVRRPSLSVFILVSTLTTNPGRINRRE